jgi:sugar (pentulose or hexulose) kinase
MILAIDLGSTSIKTGVFDHKLRQLTSGSAPVKYRTGVGSRIEFDVAVAERAVQRAIRQAKPRDIEAIAITSQAQTFTVVDQQGRATRPFVSWQDSRAMAAYESLRRSLKSFADHTSFAEVWPVLQICQIKHAPLRTHEMALSLPSYFVRLWTGENVTDDNISAMSGLYSLKLGDWWPAALSAAKLRSHQLPRVTPIGSVAALTTAAAKRFGLPSGIPVILAGNDQTSGAYGAGLEATNGLLITLGSAQVVYACLKQIPPPRAGLIRGPYPGGRGYRMAADNAGGNLTNWATTVLAGCGTHTRFFEKAARAPSGANGLRFEISDLGDSATWRNISMSHTSSDMARSIVEALSARMVTLVNRLEVNVKGREVFVAGGGSQSPLWVKLDSQALGVKLRPTLARPLLGAARMTANRG